MSVKRCWSVQLVTTTNTPNALPRSFTVSVLPVPAGPAGAPPRHMPMAWESVMKHLSVRGVMTSLSLQPRYSLLYLYSTSQMLIMHAPAPRSSEEWDCQLKRVCLSHSKSLGSEIFLLRARVVSSVDTSFWCTWMVTNVSILRRFTEEPRSCRHQLDMILRMSNCLAPQSFMEFFLVLICSRATCMSEVHSIWMPSRANCAMLLSTKLRSCPRSLTSALRSPAELRVRSFMVSCILCSSSHSQSSMLPTALTGTEKGITSWPAPPSPWMRSMMVLSFLLWST
mmetsp:Transcript_4777/g.10759  ORF Transcript_4777/g.10759 Transcript_4777/m.10759 type:complete len:282 (+) Transcript_4777:78-923(+)